MKNIIEVIKANKKAILKRGLIAGAAVVGLLGVGYLLIAKESANAELPDSVVLDEADETVDEESEED